MHNRIIFSFHVFFVRKIKEMVHLYHFLGVTGPQQFWTFVTGALLEKIE